MKLIREVIEKIKGSIYSTLCPLQIEAWVTNEPLPFSSRMEGRYRKLEIGERWGEELFDCAWFRFSCTLPEGYDGKTLFALLDVNGEMLMVDHGGNPVEGLTNQNSTFDEDLGKPGKTSYEIPGSADMQTNDLIEIWGDAGNNDLFGIVQDDGRIVRASLAVRNDGLNQLFYDFLFASSLTEGTKGNSKGRAQLMADLHTAAGLLTSFADDEVAGAASLLRPHIHSAESEGRNGFCISAIGHAHLDLAWLWPLRETVRKGARTFATVLRSMERYPEYMFGASQPQLYQWIKESYPEVYERVKERVRDGRWDVQGGLWVECDTNLVSSESLIRQLLYGISFFEQEFGIRVNNLMLPDAFGFSAALPQIMKLAGIDLFITMKPTWNLVNDFPHHSFIWKGIDGSEVPSHILPEGTYNGRGSAASFVSARDKYREKEISNHALVLYGIGDGGGGPGLDHIESLRRAGNCAELPVVRQERIVDFYKRWIVDRGSFPVWQDEIYLERHQGTFTSQGRIKKYNRMIELALFNSELLAVVAALMHNGGAAKALSDMEERRMLDEIWKESLLYQFHDILPGSSIKRVYDEVNPRYEQNLGDLERFIHDKITDIARALNGKNHITSRLLFNFTPFSRVEWVAGGKSWKKMVLPPLGFVLADETGGGQMEHQSTVDSLELKAGDVPCVIENEFLKVTFSSQGWISSILDKELKREILAEGGKGNLLSVYQDEGDCWDISPEYREKQLGTLELESQSFALDGPRSTARMKYRFRSSSLEQEVQLTSQSRRIDFVTRINWTDEAKMLRTSFDVDVRSRIARYAIQGGFIERSTHQNTSWDRAKDEVPSQSWADLSQTDRGVALLNNCKYGYRIKGKSMELNLLRSVRFPQAFINPDVEPEKSDLYTDLGEHDFIYSLYPHEGRELDPVIREAAFLNSPVKTFDFGKYQSATKVDAAAAAGPVPASSTAAYKPGTSFFSVDSPAVVIQSVKPAQQGDAVILRLHETLGGDTECTLTSFAAPSSVETCDLMEKTLEAIQIGKAGIPLKFTPFEIISLKLLF